MQQALTYDFVGAHMGSALNGLLTRSAAQLGMPLKLRIQVTSYDALCLMVAAGLGVGVLPRKSAALYVNSLGLQTVALDEPWAQRQLVLCMRSYEALPSAAQSLLHHLTDPQLRQQAPYSLKLYVCNRSVFPLWALKADDRGHKSLCKCLHCTQTPSPCLLLKH